MNRIGACAAIVLLSYGIARGGELEQARIEVYKSERSLYLYSGTKCVRAFRIALGSNPDTPKVREGDKATPEGTYYICCKNPRSKFRLSLGISYPGPRDAARGMKDGLISAQQKKEIDAASRRGETPPWNTKLGGEVFIHGGGTTRDWTWGCIALSDTDIDELYPLIGTGTPIVIFP